MPDIIDWEILSALQDNGRITYNRIARQVDLTAPAVAERVRKMEEAGITFGHTTTFIVLSEIVSRKTVKKTSKGNPPS